MPEATVHHRIACWLLPHGNGRLQVADRAWGEPDMTGVLHLAARRWPIASDRKFASHHLFASVEDEIEDGRVDGDERAHLLVDDDRDAIAIAAKAAQQTLQVRPLSITQRLDV